MWDVQRIRYRKLAGIFLGPCSLKGEILTVPVMLLQAAKQAGAEPPSALLTRLLHHGSLQGPGWGLGFRV